MVFPDYHKVGEPTYRARLEALWGGVSLDPTPGLTVVEIINAMNAGSIKGMYIMGENPAMSDPDTAHARSGLASLEHLVVQDIFLTETARFADVVLPASAWPEKSGTVTNTNRQVQMGRKALPLPGDARKDWWIVQEMAKGLGLDWRYAGPAEVFAEMKGAMPSLDHITWERLEREGTVAYPCPSHDHPGLGVVFSDRFPTESGRANLVPATGLDPAELPDPTYPMVLTTGRTLEHWHTGAMTRRASKLDALEPEPFVGMNGRDMAAHGIAPGSRVRVATRRGAIELPARRDPAIAAGMLFIPFCFNEAPANALTNPELDPIAKIPEFKYAAARVEKLEPAAAE
jgi:formate dehydrogenase major subunit